jgi:hypothetical protein
MNLKYGRVNAYDMACRKLGARGCPLVSRAAGAGLTGLGGKPLACPCDPV